MTFMETKVRAWSLLIKETAARTRQRFSPAKALKESAFA
jgi:hypothetical protein